MMTNEDIHAAVRLFAFALAGDYEQADELIKWAYKRDEEQASEKVLPLKDDASERIDFKYVLDLWNNTMTRNVPKVHKLTFGRKDKIRLRVKEMGGWDMAKRILADCFGKIENSDFCNGATGWTATFDWFFTNGDNWAKVAEGNYTNRRGKTDIDKMREEIAKADAYYEQRYGNQSASAYGNQAGGGYYGPDEQ